MNSKLKLALSVVGYILGAAAGITGIVVGAMQSEPGYIVIGVAFLAAVVVAFIAGATASPRGSVSGPKYGAKFTPPGLGVVGRRRDHRRRPRHRRDTARHVNTGATGAEWTD